MNRSEVIHRCGTRTTPLLSHSAYVDLRLPQRFGNSLLPLYNIRLERQ
jgi:hypothetical protein